MRLLMVFFFMVTVQWSRRNCPRVIDIGKRRGLTVFFILVRVITVLFQVHVSLASSLANARRGWGLWNVMNSHRLLVHGWWQGGLRRPRSRFRSICLHLYPLLSQHGPVHLLWCHGLVVRSPLVLSIRGERWRPAVNWTIGYRWRLWCRSTTIIWPHDWLVTLKIKTFE